MSQVGSASSAFASSTNVKSGFSALTSEEFTKLVLTELSNQDPLSPNDTNQLLQQISTIRSIQSDVDLSDGLTGLVSQNEFASASTLIGKSISGLTEDRTRVEGLVASVSRTKDGPVLTLSDGTRVAMNQVDAIREPAPAGV
jgi:flagellar basal-body rod modification protein FlgD